MDEKVNGVASTTFLTVTPAHSDVYGGVQQVEVPTVKSKSNNPDAVYMALQG